LSSFSDDDEAAEESSLTTACNDKEDDNMDLIRPYNYLDLENSKTIKGNHRKLNVITTTTTIISIVAQRGVLLTGEILGFPRVFRRKMIERTQLSRTYILDVVGFHVLRVQYGSWLMFSAGVNSRCIQHERVGWSASPVFKFVIEFNHMARIACKRNLHVMSEASRHNLVSILHGGTAKIKKHELNVSIEHVIESTTLRYVSRTLVTELGCTIGGLMFLHIDHKVTHFPAMVAS
jgi:hypothetical protein